ncbi:uncharacterized protein LACBIDRAFT_308553 [Laccaria bicolor S238N-H82]|uniref:Predicted protein n=1 Tax=Laccaria bicolor (strain S238N-H82 / ATCC MYA-4686) TaxID=486041 RepID=B0CWM8_LACBS|nr:uncharacterized protein LACBIDRAFT_308553 [Laccaria bicolor S238N-H82]EDR13537.1 predicted protein [Laccaria bicolor S238N-H82]|eukprot:XP_001876035.1 predicted protein [Laccaria bicolor S238N-H82]
MRQVDRVRPLMITSGINARTFAVLLCRWLLMKLEDGEGRFARLRFLHRATRELLGAVRRCEPSNLGLRPQNPAFGDHDILHNNAKHQLPSHAAYLFVSVQHAGPLYALCDFS